MCWAVHTHMHTTITTTSLRYDYYHCYGRSCGEKMFFYGDHSFWPQMVQLAQASAITVASRHTFSCSPPPGRLLARVGVYCATYQRPDASWYGSNE